MNLTIKKIVGGTEIDVQVGDYDSVLSVKEQIRSHLGIPTHQQKLVHRGKTLQDDKSVSECGLKNNTKLFLALKKEDSPTVSNNFSQQLQQLLQKYYTDKQSEFLAESVQQDLKKMVQCLSLDDLERFAKVMNERSK